LRPIVAAYDDEQRDACDVVVAATSRWRPNVVACARGHR
jgi:hypothetical protein